MSDYLLEISDILNRVPRQLLLIFKTNDVLRGIEASLHTRANATSFINMSRCCIRAVAQDERRQCEGAVGCVLRTRLREHWQLLRVSVYEFVMWVVSSSWFRWLGLNRTEVLYS